MNAKWKRTTKDAPCPICNQHGWCSVTPDGSVAKCMKQAQGAFKTKQDKNGADYYLHRLTGDARVSVEPFPKLGAVSAARASGDVLHRVYAALLEALTLSQDHRDNLRKRGLSVEEIERRRYRSLPVQGRAKIARSLQERFGEQVRGVPGFVARRGKGDVPYLTIAGAAGLLIPVRGIEGNIVGLLVRRDEEGPAKYLWISSTGDGGPGPGVPAHVPLGTDATVEKVRITEGALKADVAQALSGMPAIGMPGVGNWRPAIELVRTMGCKTVCLAIDRDAEDKPSVARALQSIEEALVSMGCAIELERWPAEHKGIDDALAAGAAIDVVTGAAARDAITEIVVEAEASQPLPEPGPLDNAAEVLAKGPMSLFRDGELLKALARLAESDPAEFACRRAQIQNAGIKLRDLDKALTPLRQAIRAEQPPLDAADAYKIVAGRIVHVRPTLQGGFTEVPLANWSGRIVEELVHDDGADQQMIFSIEGALADGTPLPRAEVVAKDFCWMRWPVEQWGLRAVVFAGASTADHLRTAIQLLSPNAPRRTVFGQTGWRSVNGEPVYLHACGAIGKDGVVDGVEVRLPDALAQFRLPVPPTGQERIEAVATALRLLDIGKDQITVLLLAAVFRAVLAECDFSIFLVGSSGHFKTEAASLAQRFFGPEMHAKNLPTNWDSTANSIESLAFSAAQAVLVCDDFAPGGSSADVQRKHRDADRLLRAQGNNAGRQRMRADATLQKSKKPRGLIVSTGEDVPRGQSLRSRMFIVEIDKGDIKEDRLTLAQADAASGLYAACLAAFLQWFAPRYDKVRSGLAQERTELRNKVLAECGKQHARTPNEIADLTIGLRYFFQFAVDAGAINQTTADKLKIRCWKALTSVGATQSEHVESAEPCGFFLRLLCAAISSGRAHVAGSDGLPPGESPEAWGWRMKESPCRDSFGQPNTSTTWIQQGKLIGWLEGDNLFLQPDAAYAEAQALAGQQGESLPIAERTLRKRLKEKNLLLTWDQKRERNTVRKTLQGVMNREVLHLSALSLTDAVRPSKPSKPSESEENPENFEEKWTVPLDGRDSVGRSQTADRPTESSRENDKPSTSGRFGRSDTGESQGIRCPKCNGELNAERYCGQCFDRLCARCGNLTGSFFSECCVACKTERQP